MTDTLVSSESPNAANRKRAFLIFGGVLLAVAASAVAYEWIEGGRYVETDNAYVAAETAQVSPLVSGQVAQVAAINTQVVKAGDVLVVIDPADARLSLAAANADYATALSKARQTVATGTALASQEQASVAAIIGAKAQVGAAEADLTRAGIDLKRREGLVGDGSVSAEELTSARDAYARAQAALASARANLSQAQAARGAAGGQTQANAALLANATPENNPQVLSAKARVDKARLDLERTVIRAPVAGIVTGRTVQVGQSVSPGTPLLSVVPVSSAYVDANYKENQLAKVRVGQPVSLWSDLYGSDVKFHGRVIGFSGGTGSALAVIPAQNATGNWIKVVQRLPVRVAIDAKDLAAHPLRIGLSINATIDTGAH